MKRTTGFTLVEVMVALTLAGVAVLATHRIFTGVVDGVRHLERARQSLDREANARQLLAALVGSIEVDRDHAFQGEPHLVAFTSWQADGLGRTARRRADIRLQDRALTLQGIYPEPLILADGVTAVALDYLLELGAEQRFVREWHSVATAPAALRIRLMRGSSADTLLLLIGWRG